MTGDLDHYSAPGIRRLLPGLDIGQGQQLVVDLSGLTFCDSSGITVLLVARNHALASRATARQPKRPGGPRQTDPPDSRPSRTAGRSSAVGPSVDAKQSTRTTVDPGERRGSRCRTVSRRRCRAHAPIRPRSWAAARCLGHAVAR
ncbi:STAS domain-containing protein [Streptomyces hygroscopicus]|uniref:STAS domain-containing protein n=1 Tax=Streptomyces sp. KHY 26 TaxID=3097359 RepID=UPI0025574A1B|nr:STAS domain-containing protein [Streptomyces hygroscopicus]